MFVFVFVFVFVSVSVSVSMLHQAHLLFIDSFVFDDGKRKFGVECLKQQTHLINCLCCSYFVALASCYDADLVTCKVFVYIRGCYYFLFVLNWPVDVHLTLSHYVFSFFFSCKNDGLNFAWLAILAHTRKSVTDICTDH